MELLSDSDKEEFVRLTDAIYEWKQHTILYRERFLQS